MSPARISVIVCCLTPLLVAGCGRRGPLDPAPEAGIALKQAREENARRPDDAEGVEYTRRARNVTPVAKTFVLDPLL